MTVDALLTFAIASLTLAMTNEALHALLRSLEELTVGREGEGDRLSAVLLHVEVNTFQSVVDAAHQRPRGCSKSMIWMSIESYKPSLHSEI
jgi:uncharacterized protein YicC (UPF0701 family)